MKKILILLLAIVLGTGMSMAFVDSYTIDRDKLPEAARTMLQTYFPKARVSMIKVDRHLLKKTDYEVKLTNGTEIDFNNSGKWKSVECKTGAVPDGLVPKAIKKHVAANYPDTQIVSIEKKSSGYVIELSDDIELQYNLLGQLKKIKMD